MRGGGTRGRDPRLYELCRNTTLRVRRVCRGKVTARRKQSSTRVPMVSRTARHHWWEHTGSENADAERTSIASPGMWGRWKIEHHEIEHMQGPKTCCSLRARSIATHLGCSCAHLSQIYQPCFRPWDAKSAATWRSARPACCCLAKISVGVSERPGSAS